jgi:hypothetical protein
VVTDTNVSAHPELDRNTNAADAIIRDVGRSAMGCVVQSGSTNQKPTALDRAQEKLKASTCGKPLHLLTGSGFTVRSQDGLAGRYSRKESSSWFHRTRVKFGIEL